MMRIGLWSVDRIADGLSFTVVSALSEGEPQVPQTDAHMRRLSGVDWVEIPGGTFTMGHPSHAESRPLRQVTVPTFDDQARGHG